MKGARAQQARRLGSPTREQKLCNHADRAAAPARLLPSCVTWGESPSAPVPPAVNGDTDLRALHTV